MGIIRSLALIDAGMEKWCLCIIISIAFLNNKLSDYFFFFFAYVAYGMTVTMLREDPSVILWETQDGLV